MAILVLLVGLSSQTTSIHPMQQVLVGTVVTKGWVVECGAIYLGGVAAAATYPGDPGRGVEGGG